MLATENRGVGEGGRAVLLSLLLGVGGEGPCCHRPGPVSAVLALLWTVEAGEAVVAGPRGAVLIPDRTATRGGCSPRRGGMRRR